MIVDAQQLTLETKPSIEKDKETVASRNNRSYLKKSYKAPVVIKKKRNTICLQKVDPMEEREKEVLLKMVDVK
jgi:hypothetical protein